MSEYFETSDLRHRVLELEQREFIGRRLSAEERQELLELSQLWFMDDETGAYAEGTYIAVAPGHGNFTLMGQEYLFEEGF